MNYGKTKSLTRTFKMQCAQNVRTVAQPGQSELLFLSEIIDQSFSIAGHYVWTTSMPHVARLNPANKILLAAIHKNFISFCVVLDLMRKGLYGPSRMILRHVFEGLVIAKFCALNRDRGVFERWEKGEYVPLTNDVLNKIKTPDPDPFRKLWKILCAFTHATVHSQQPILDAKKNLDEILLTFHITRALLECNYHLLTQHFVTSSMKHFEKHYGEGHKVPMMKAELRRHFARSRKHMFPPFAKLVLTYRRTWIMR